MGARPFALPALDPPPLAVSARRASRGSTRCDGARGRHRNRSRNLAPRGGDPHCSADGTGTAAGQRIDVARRFARLGAGALVLQRRDPEARQRARRASDQPAFSGAARSGQAPGSCEHAHPAASARRTLARDAVATRRRLRSSATEGDRRGSVDGPRARRTQLKTTRSSPCSRWSTKRSEGPSSFPSTEATYARRAVTFMPRAFRTTS
jgi:hypothetical protein